MQLSRLGFIRAFIESVGPSIRCGVSGALPSRYTVDARARSTPGRASGFRGRPPGGLHTAPHAARPGGPGRGLGGPAGPRGAARAGAVRGYAWRWSGRGRRADRGLPSPVPSGSALKNLLNQSIELKR